jgi:hypothetical protein
MRDTLKLARTRLGKLFAMRLMLAALFCVAVLLSHRSSRRRRRALFARPTWSSW